MGLASRHLVSGTARFAGALMTVVNLTIGTAIALTCAQLLGIEPHVRAWRPQPDWVVWGAVAVAAYAFAVLFQAHRRDYGLVMAAAISGYLSFPLWWRMVGRTGRGVSGSFGYHSRWECLCALG